jgi:hypothetical protein
MMKSIFAESKQQSVIDNIKESLSVFVDEETGETMVSFSPNEGKGTGAQILPVAEFDEYVAQIEAFASEGLPEEGAVRMTAAETARKTAAVDEGILTCRATSGKGAKPAKYPVGQLGQIAAFLRSTVEAVEAAASSMDNES